MSKRWRAVCYGAMLALTVNGHAATAYRVAFSSTGRGLLFDGTRVIVSDSKLRADMLLAAEAPRLYDMILSLDGGTTLVAVNHELKTWFRLERSPFAVHSHLFSVMGGEFKAKHITWSEESSGQRIGALESRRVGRLSYVIEQVFGGTSVQVRHEAVVSLWPMREQRLTIRWPHDVPLSTGLPQVDTKISPTLLTAFPARIVVVARRQYAGGEWSSETHTVIVDDVRQVPDPPSEFFLPPPGYREQAPIIGAPGQ